jgi:hypothetical protein
MNKRVFDIMDEDVCVDEVADVEHGVREVDAAYHPGLPSSGTSRLEQ